MRGTITPPQLAMNASYALLIILTLVGFFLLAAVLLVPVYRFLEREEQASKRWTEEELAKRLQEQQSSTNGSEAPDAQPPRDADE